MDSIEIFLDIFRTALTLVNEDYYGRSWWNESALNAILGEAKTKTKEGHSLKKYFDKYGERVFCYELYHQTRTLMDAHSKGNPHTFDKIILQSELKKETIGDIIEKIYNVKALSSQFIPDFLLHSPGNFERQRLIIEVKSSPTLTFSGITKDLLKIQEFISKYQYERGIFLTVNTDPDKFSKIICNKKSKQWLQTYIETPEKIHIMCKETNNTDLYEIKIAEII